MQDSYLHMRYLVLLGMWACSLQTGSCSVLSLCAHLISTNDSVLTRLGFLGTRNKSVTKTLILQIAKAPHILLILIVASYESSALALVPESQLAKLSCCPRAEPVPHPVSSRAGRHGEPGASISPVWCVWRVTCDVWHVTCGTWRVMCYMWRVMSSGPTPSSDSAPSLGAVAGPCISQAWTSGWCGAHGSS